MPLIGISLLGLYKFVPIAVVGAAMVLGATIVFGEMLDFDDLQIKQLHYQIIISNLLNVPKYVVEMMERSRC